jgi:hypothetical protein
VSDPFESPLHFDLGDHRVYVADKLVVGAEGGRLLPIPKSLSVEIERYFGYLEKLGQLFASSQPAFSAALLGLHESRPPFRLPLFFYLGKEGWESVSEEGLRRSLGSGAFPAPINVFRHRLPVALRARGVDPEVIDGLLGMATEVAALTAIGRSNGTSIWSRAVRRLRVPSASWHCQSSPFSGPHRNGQGACGAGRPLWTRAVSVDNGSGRGRPTAERALIEDCLRRSVERYC